MRDIWKEQRVIEKAVDMVFEYAKKPANPYNYLYHNPRAIHTPQYLAHWTQKWQNHHVYMTLVRAATVTGYEPVPSVLLLRNAKRDGYGGRAVRVGHLVFYLIRPEEMTPGLQRRYYKFKNMLMTDISRDMDKYYENKKKKTMADNVVVE
ncbi:MAG TPA: hypothetical protein GXX39_02415 [Syntrophothermus lipocalidus]|uniref:Uncharacterized protein n=1 Tax=Syntrophothermus lipocalidus (strain DSM 12680 / TGB-C1) TaxID=643648 RepID=D7CPB8_SYNLT|nr:hypothetical protein [Syntrophothermus lipocalidus]ADI02553.1 hypothetical protein Slip_1798 [Syntrophothermus lipocalidus DSM 12680]HHV76212.1 hypothetical protein [Syntrophothermus lipocalidus]